MIPLGSVLGPILFSVYINDEVRSRVKLFADDTVLYLTMESEDGSSALQTDLDILSAWQARWDIEFSPSECQVVHVKGSKKTVKTDYVLHGQVLEFIPCARYLIRRNIKTKMTKVRKAAYNSLVRPQLEYALAVWDLHTKLRISQIEQVQRRAACWTVSNFDRQSSVTEMIKLGWRSLEQRRAGARLCLFYKVIHGLVAVPLPDYTYITLIEYQGNVFPLFNGIPFLSLLHACKALMFSRQLSAS